MPSRMEFRPAPTFLNSAAISVPTLSPVLKSALRQRLDLIDTARGAASLVTQGQ